MHEDNEQTSTRRSPRTQRTASSVERDRHRARTGWGMAPALAASASAVLSLGFVSAAWAAPGGSHRTERAAHRQAATSGHDGPALVGRVTSVGGSETLGTCGADGGTGTFSVRDGEGSTVTVDVTTSTVFFDRAVTVPSFADVCVGSHVAVPGSPSAGALSAGQVIVLVHRHHRAPALAGTVGVHRPPHDDATPPGTGTGTGTVPSDAAAPSSTGSTASGGATDAGAHSAGAPDAGTATGSVTGRVIATSASSITLSRDGDPVTVSITTSTTFTGPTGPSSLASLQAGDTVHVVGSVAGGLFTAGSVTIVPTAAPGPDPQNAWGSTNPAASPVPARPQPVGGDEAGSWGQGGSPAGSPTSGPGSRGEPAGSGGQR